MAIAFKEIVTGVNSRFYGRDKIPTPYQINLFLNDCLNDLSVQIPYQKSISYTGKTTDNFALSSAGTTVLKVYSVVVNGSTSYQVMTEDEYKTGSWANNYVCMVRNKQDDLYLIFPNAFVSTDVIDVLCGIAYVEQPDTLATANIAIAPIWKPYLIYSVLSSLAIMQDFADANMYQIYTDKARALKCSIKDAIAAPDGMRFKGWEVF